MRRVVISVMSMSAQPGFRIGIDEKASSDIAADIVHEHGDRAKPIGGLQCPRRRLGIEQVGADKNGLVRTPFQRLSDQPFTGLLIAPDCHQPGPFSGELQRDGPSDIGGRAGDHHDFSSQFQVHGAPHPLLPLSNSTSNVGWCPGYLHKLAIFCMLGFGLALHFDRHGDMGEADNHIYYLFSLFLR